MDDSHHIDPQPPSMIGARAGFHPFALHAPPALEPGAVDASEIVLECVGRRAARRASAPTTGFGYHPHVVRVRPNPVMEGPLPTPAVVVLDAVSGRQQGVCPGPSPDGRCPMAATGETVPCAGRRVRAALAIGRRSRFLVPAGSTICPLAWQWACGWSPSTDDERPWPVAVRGSAEAWDAVRPVAPGTTGQESGPSALARVGGDTHHPRGTVGAGRGRRDPLSEGSQR